VCLLVKQCTHAGYNAFIGIACAWFGLFTPGIVLMFACLPFWAKFRQWQVYRRALPGESAARASVLLSS
jgi:chromate transporter